MSFWDPTPTVTLQWIDNNLQPSSNTPTYWDCQASPVTLNAKQERYCDGQFAVLSDDDVARSLSFYNQNRHGLNYTVTNVASGLGPEPPTPKPPGFQVQPYVNPQVGLANATPYVATYVVNYEPSVAELERELAARQRERDELRAKVSLSAQIANLDFEIGSLRSQLNSFRTSIQFHNSYR